MGINNENTDNRKLHERDAKANIKDWVNQVTKDDNGFFTIHFACFLG